MHTLTVSFFSFVVVGRSYKFHVVYVFVFLVYTHNTDICVCVYISSRNCFGLSSYFIVLKGIDVNAHDIRFVEDNWESPVRLFFHLIRDI